MTASSELGQALIFSGPHGAGKDTLEQQFRAEYENAQRVVRHITRPQAADEVDGQDYYFVSSEAFQEMIDAEAFIEHAAYPDCMSGTSRQELFGALGNAGIASFASNLEDALPTHETLQAEGIKSTCLFVSPVSLPIFQSDEKQYLSELEARMAMRGRSHDRIANKLAKAAVYRNLYFENQGNVAFIDNSAGRQREAVYDILRLVTT
jgi:guanylate kinase